MNEKNHLQPRAPPFYYHLVWEQLSLIEIATRRVSATAGQHCEPARKSLKCYDRSICNYLRVFPGFRRYQVEDGEESTLVDIVHESVPQIVPLEEKPLRDGVRVDSIEDLVANKLCAVLGRSDVKDLVDLYFLSEFGLDVLDHLQAAYGKDGGMEPATLAFVLQQMPTDPRGLLLLRQVDTGTLAAFRDGLVARLLKLAWPGQ